MRLSKADKRQRQHLRQLQDCGQARNYKSIQEHTASLPKPHRAPRFNETQVEFFHHLNNSAVQVGSFIPQDCGDRNSLCVSEHLFPHLNIPFCYYPLSLPRAFTQSTGISLSPLLRRRWSRAGWKMRKRRRSFLPLETPRVTMIP